MIKKVTDYLGTVKRKDISCQLDMIIEFAIGIYNKEDIKILSFNHLDLLIFINQMLRMSVGIYNNRNFSEVLVMINN